MPASFIIPRTITVSGPVILIDEPTSQATIERIGELRTKDGAPFTIIHATDLAATLEDFLASAFAVPGAVPVFVGNGSNYPKRFSAACQSTPGLAVPAKRLWVPGCDPVAIIGAFLPEYFMLLRKLTFVAVDDVISSGTTLRTLRERNAWRFPAASWTAAAWIIQDEQLRLRSGVRTCYDTVFASCAVKHARLPKAAINSISTLRESAELRDDYASRHLRTPEELTELFAPSTHAASL
jgi:hypothetical protein